MDAAKGFLSPSVDLLAAESYNSSLEGDTREEAWKMASGTLPSSASSSGRYCLS